MALNGIHKSIDIEKKNAFWNEPTMCCYMYCFELMANIRAKSSIFAQTKRCIYYYLNDRIESTDQQQTNICTSNKLYLYIV